MSLSSSQPPGRPLRPLKRLIVIDGANFMHGVKEIYPAVTSSNDDRANALPLALFMLDLIKKGYRVRVCLLPNYDEKNTRNYEALQMLIKNKLAIEATVNGKETDDLCVLEIGRKYGAAIISNDRYSNHRDYYDVTRILKFESLRTDWDPDDFVDSSKFRSPTTAVKIRLTEQEMVAYPGDPDYKKLAAAMKRFDPPTDEAKRIMDAFRDYIYDSYYFKMYMELPKMNHFVKNPNKFPTCFKEYLKLWKLCCNGTSLDR